MTRDEELEAILATLGGSLDDAELDRRTVGFRAALRWLREDPAEATRIDRLLADAGDDTTVTALVTSAVAGDQDAWNAMVERYSPLVWSICTRFELSPADAGAVGQQVWLLLVERLSGLREPAVLPGWLAATTTRECQRMVTASRRFEWQAADDPATGEQILIGEQNEALRAAFAALPLQSQKLLSMLISDPPYSYAEISAALQIPIGSIGPMRARCLARLRGYGTFGARIQEKPGSASGDAGAGE